MRVLRGAEAGSPVEAIATVTREVGELFSATDVSFLIADLSGRALVRLGHDGPLDPEERRDQRESAVVVPFDGGPEEQAVRTPTVQVLPPAEGATEPGTWRVLAPVTERGESIGVLELELPDAPDPATVRDVGWLAHLLAFILIANRRHTDLFEWGRRSQAFSLSAEIQQRLLPESRTCEASAFTLSGWLEPAASIGGDTFDYSLARDVLHLSLTDAMGHGVDAALTATVCLGSLRGARRAGRSLREQASATNAAVAEHASKGKDDFVTGLVGRLDLRTGRLELINAGHVAPYLVRGGSTTAVQLGVNLPFGIFSDTEYSSSWLDLEPGDRLVFVTDGMLERNVARVDLVDAIETTRELHPRELVRALADRALEATGHALSDDATVLCIDWHGRHDLQRTSSTGADQARASDPLDQDRSSAQAS